MSLWSRLANVFQAGRVERDLDEEMQFHLDERIRDLMAAGMTREEAARQAARTFGNTLRLREQSRDVKLQPWLDSLVRDVQIGARMLRKHAVATTAAVMSLTLALGACLAAFALVDALILRPLPVAHPEQLVYLASPTDNPERPEADTFNDPLFLRLRDSSRGYVDLFAMSTQVIRPVTFDGPGAEKEPVRTQYVSGDAFDRLGVLPAVGRLVTMQDDERPGAHPVAVISHAFWTRRFGGDHAVLGRWFTLGDRQFQIVGVAERRFTGIEPGRPTDVWFPYAMYNPRAFGNASFGWFRVIGRVKTGVRLEQAQSVLHAAYTTFRREYAPRLFGPAPPPARLARFLETPLYLRPAANGPSPLRHQFERSLWVLASIAALVLLIAGSNVANLFLARAAAREREMALRLSIGAGRGRLIQQMLVESALVAAAACVLGLVFAKVAGPAVVGMLAVADDPIQLDLALDWRGVVCAAGLTLLTTAIFGLAPALRSSNVAPLTALKTGGGRSTAGLAMRPFVAIQVAFSLIVLFVGSLLVLSFVRLSNVNPGFATSDVLLMNLESTRPADPAEQRAALLDVLDRLRAVPGVQSVSSAESNLLGRAWTHYVQVPGTEHETIEATMNPVTEGYFDTMNIQVLAGRPLIGSDLGPEGKGAIVVNRTFATRYFGREQALGRTIDARFDGGEDKDTHEIVGIVADTRYDLRKAAAPMIYIPLRQRSVGTVHVRVAGAPLALAPRLREVIRAGSSVLRVTNITTQSTLVERTLLRERLLAMLSGFFGLVGLVLAAVGLHGVLSDAIVQRTREIGIRVALGARQLRVLRTVLTGTGSAALAGAAAGLAGGLYASRFVQTLLFEVTPLDFWSLALPLGMLLLASLLAATLPALRLARVDPVIALRYE